jgi:hypothetical protein
LYEHITSILIFEEDLRETLRHRTVSTPRMGCKASGETRFVRLGGEREMSHFLMHVILPERLIYGYFRVGQPLCCTSRSPARYTPGGCIRVFS